MSQKTLPYKVDALCPPRLAPDPWCAYCELTIPKDPKP